MYDGEALKTSGVDYTLTLSTNYQSQGLITTIDFVTQPVGLVTCRGIGKAITDDDNDPITQLDDLLTTRGGMATTDRDGTALEAARATSLAKGYQTAWVVNDDRPLGEWLTEWMFNVMGGWYIAGDGRLVLLVDDGNWPTPDRIIAHIVAARDVVDWDDGVTMSGSERDLVNALTVHYLYNWALNQPSSRITSEQDLVSINAHGGDPAGVARKAVTLKGHRRAADITTWATILFERQSFRRRIEGAVLRFTVRGAKLLHATIGDWIGLSWAWGPTREEGNAYRNEIVRILGVRHDVAAEATEVTAVDIGGYLTTDEYFDADAGGSLRDGYFNADDFFGGGRDLAVHA